MFPTTRWTLVLEARGDHKRALEELLAGYWKPLYLYARYLGLGPSDAEDAVQGVFAALLERDFLSAVDRDKGRLRGYLRQALRNHLADVREREGAAKRGGGARPIAIDGASVEHTIAATSVDSPDAAYDRVWAVQLLDNAFERLRAEWTSGQRDGPFELVEAYFSVQAAVSYDQLSERFAMTIPQLKSFLHRARTRFRELVAEEVAQTVERPEDVEAELTYLRALLA